MNRRSFLRGLLGIPAVALVSKIPIVEASPLSDLILPYKGKTAFDAGVFYCPYVPLQGVRAGTISEIDHAPVSFKTRYGPVTRGRIKVYIDETSTKKNSTLKLR